MGKASKNYGPMATPKTRSGGNPKLPTPKTRGDKKALPTPKGRGKGA
jgi:hypothetical protein